MNSSFRLDRLSEAHDRSAFTCGEEALDRYFRTQVTQDIRRKITNCFVATEAASGLVAGYYTLAASSIPTIDLPSEVTRKLPRYPTILAARIGRLAVDRRFHGRGLGAALLYNAAVRTLDATPAAYALLVDAKTDRAAAFYQHHGFTPFASQPRTLYLPLATATRVHLPTLKRD